MGRIEGNQPGKGGAHWPELAFCFAVAAGAAWLTTLLWNPLGHFLAEEYLELARTLRSTGSLETVLRPPGYVAFLALAGIPESSLHSANPLSVFLIQGVLHGATAVILREEIGWSGRGPGPLLLVLTFGLSPIALIGTTYLHYETVHVFLLILAAATVRRACAEDSRVWVACAAGVIAAMLALVRPMTLPWLFLLVALGPLQGRSSMRVFARKAAPMLLGFVLALVPYALRNFQKTGRVIVVNAQAGAALWPMTEVDLHPDPAEFPWVRLWLDVGKPLVASSAPQLAGEDDPFQTETIAVNDVLLERSKSNLIRNPMRYFRNVGRNSWFFISASGEEMVTLYRFVQGSNELKLQPFRRFCAAAGELMVIWTGFLCLVLCFVRRRSSWFAAGSLFICLWVVHSALYLDFRYLYVRSPLCLLIAGIALCGPDSDQHSKWGKAGAIIPVILFSGTLLALGATFA